MLERYGFVEFQADNDSIDSWGLPLSGIPESGDDEKKGFIPHLDIRAG
jgi:hypothetical protein